MSFLSSLKEGSSLSFHLFVIKTKEVRLTKYIATTQQKFILSSICSFIVE